MSATLDDMLAEYDTIKGEDSRAKYRNKVKKFVINNNYFTPLTQPKINNGVPDSVLEELVRRFKKNKKKWYTWNLGDNDDDAYLVQLTNEIKRREQSPEPNLAVKVRRANYERDRENLSEKIPLYALELKKRDILNVKRYNPNGYDDADKEYMREVKRLITLQKYRKTMKQKQKPYEAIDHFETPTKEEQEEQVEETKIAENRPEPRRSSRFRKQTDKFEAGQGATLNYKKDRPTSGVNDIDPDVDRIRKAPANYKFRALEKTIEEEQPSQENELLAEQDDDVNREPSIPIEETESKSGMSQQQLKRVENLYYGTDTSPPMVSSAQAMYPLLLAEGDPPSMSQLKIWINEQGLNQTFKPFFQKGSDVKPFTATVPLRNLAMDLFTATDYGSKELNKQSRKYKYWDRWGKGGYALIVIDEYSRVAFTESLNSKSDKEVAIKLSKILDRISEMNGNKQINYIRSDDGSEFKGDVQLLLKNRGIRNVRTLGSAPQSNGQAERAVSSIRKTLARQYVVSGQSWRSLLPKATQVHNKKINRTTGKAPIDAVEDDTKADLQELRSRQFESQARIGTEPRPDLEVGTIVKLRVSPDSMNKTSKQSFYENPLVIKQVVKGNAVQATRYRLEDPTVGASNQRILAEKLYPRNYINVVGDKDETIDDVRKRENMSQLKKGRWLRAVR